MVNKEQLIPDLAGKALSYHEKMVERISGKIDPVTESFKNSAIESHARIPVRAAIRHWRAARAIIKEWKI